MNRKKEWRIKKSFLFLFSIIISIVFLESCNKENDLDVDNQSIIQELKSHKWFNGTTYVDIDNENLYAQIDKDSRWLFFLTDTTAVTVDVSSSAGTDGYNYKGRTYTYYRYDVGEDGTVVLRPEGNKSAVRYKYTGSNLAGTNDYMDLYPTPLSGDADFIAEQSKLAQIHLMSNSERLENIGHVDVNLLNCGAIDKTQNYFNLTFTTETRDYLLERGLTSLRLYISSSVAIANGSKTVTKTYGITDNDKQSHGELYQILTAASSVTLNVTLKVYDSKVKKDYYLIESQELTFNIDGSSTTGGATDDNNSADGVAVSGEIGGYDYVDLGLPSGTLWATCNVGAESPEDYGLYFTWGETTGYSIDGTGNSATITDGHSFRWSNYKWCNGSSSTITKYCTSNKYGTVDNMTELETADDAATVTWGSNWQMPSNDQIKELCNSEYTTSEWTTQNGVIGRKITSKINNNSIFFPSAGFRAFANFYGAAGWYWSRSLDSDNSDYAYCLNVYYKTITLSNSTRDNGQSVRPVCVHR